MTFPSDFLLCLCVNFLFKKINKNIYIYIYIYSSSFGIAPANSLYNGIYNRKNLRKHKIPIFGTNIHSYELKSHPHIEEDQTKLVGFIKNNQFQRFFFNCCSRFCHYNGASLKWQNLERLFTPPPCVVGHVSHYFYKAVELVGGGSVINGAYPV